jgi:hypothetical protein
VPVAKEHNDFSYEFEGERIAAELLRIDRVFGRFFDPPTTSHIQGKYAGTATNLPVYR